jgi:hypothetical protein
MVVAGELPDTLITTTADRASVLAMVADTGDMAMDMDMDMARDMAIDVGDFGGFGPLFFRKLLVCAGWPLRSPPPRPLSGLTAS